MNNVDLIKDARFFVCKDCLYNYIQCKDNSRYFVRYVGEYLFYKIKNKSMSEPYASVSPYFLYRFLDDHNGIDIHGTADNSYNILGEKEYKNVICEF